MCGFDIGYRKFSNILRGFNLLYFAGICFRGKRQNLRKLIHAKIMTGLFYLHIVIHYAILEWGRTYWILKRVYGKWCKLDFVPRRECTKYSYSVPTPRYDLFCQMMYILSQIVYFTDWFYSKKCEFLKKTKLFLN